MECECDCAYTIHPNTHSIRLESNRNSPDACVGVLYSIFFLPFKHLDRISLHLHSAAFAQLVNVCMVYIEPSACHA